VRVKFLSMVLALTLALTLAACGGDDGDDPVSVADATNCEQLVDAFIPLMQDMLDSVSDMTMADMMSDDTPEPLVEFEADMEELTAKSDELECDDDEMSELLEGRIDELEADGPVAELLLEALKTEGLD